MAKGHVIFELKFLEVIYSVLSKVDVGVWFRNGARQEYACHLLSNFLVAPWTCDNDNFIVWSCWC